LLCGGVTACPSMACVLCAVRSTAHSTHIRMHRATIKIKLPIPLLIGKSFHDEFKI